jgi:hypothetical protein
MAFKSCTHVKADGLRCGSPALRGESFCYFHHHSADHRPRTQARVVQIPFPENAAAIQVGIHNLMLAIIDRRIDERRAQQLLWALQIAAGQGRQLPFDNNLLMSRTVTQLPAYEVEELEQKEEERRIMSELRMAKPTSPAPAETAAIPNSPAPVKTAVIPTGAALRGGVEGPCVPPHQHDADAPTHSSDAPVSSSDLDSALSGDWRAVDRLFRAAGLVPG